MRRSVGFAGFSMMCMLELCMQSGVELGRYLARLCRIFVNSFDMFPQSVVQALVSRIDFGLFSRLKCI